MTESITELPPPNRRTPESDDYPKGPSVGDLLPDFTLPDQHGRMVSYDEARAGRRAPRRLARGA